MTFTNPQFLVSTGWLAENLGDPALRILDCSVFLRPPAPPSMYAIGGEPGRGLIAQGSGYALPPDRPGLGIRLRYGNKR